MDIDREVLNAAADRGLLAAYWAERQPDKVAIRSAVGDRTFVEVASDANRLVRALRARGVKAGDGLALMSSNRPEFAETVVAVRQAGLRLTTINWHLTAEEAGYIVDDCDATAFVADARFAEAAAGAAKQAPKLKARIAIGGGIGGRAGTGIDGFEAWDDVLAEQSSDAIDDPRAGGLMLYTSGTTGRPKGVRKARGDPRADLDVGMQTQYDPDRHVHLLTGPLYHAAPLAFSWSAPAALGVPIVMMDGWGAEETLRLIAEHGITHTHMVPTMFHRLLSLPDEVKAKYDVSSLMFILHGAAPCPVEVKKRLMAWLGPIVWEYYAATEGSGTLVSPHQWLRRPGTVGKVDPPDHVRILHVDGADAGPGEVGTVYLKAPGQAATGRFEYYKAPEKTAGAYVDSGAYFTLGDYGYVDADGYLFLTDRSAHLIISGGVNIYPAEVEAELIGHPAVGDVGVVGVPDDDWGEIVVAVVEPQPGVSPSPELAAELVEWCRDRIAHYKCPRRVEFTEALPRHDNGKLYKHPLREQLRNQ